MKPGMNCHIVGCTQFATHTCGVCDGRFCNGHAEHGPWGDEQHGTMVRKLKGGEKQHASEHKDWVAPNGACALCARELRQKAENTVLVLEGLVSEMQREVRLTAQTDLDGTTRYVLFPSLSSYYDKDSALVELRAATETSRREHE